MPQLVDLMRANEGMITETSQEALALLEETLNDLTAKTAQIEYMKGEIGRWQTSEESLRKELEQMK